METETACITGLGGSAALLAILKLDLPLAYQPVTSVSKRVVFFTICLFGSVDLTIYGAGLTSELAHNIYSLPIKILEDLVKNPRSVMLKLVAVFSRI